MELEMDHVDEAEDGGAGAGWPLGLPPVTLQLRLANAFGTASHPVSSTFLLATPTCSSLESSDLDTESSLFSFQARSITLGSLMGIRSSGSEPNLIRGRSLALSSSCSQVSIPHSHINQSCCALRLICRKLVIRRQQFKRITTDSAKLCNNFLIRCAACIRAQRKQTRSRRSKCMQPIEEDIVSVSSLAHLLQMDREPCNTMLPTPDQTVLMNVMYESAASVDNSGPSVQIVEAEAVSGRGRQCAKSTEGGHEAMVASRGGRGTCMNMGSMKRRGWNRKYTREREAHQLESLSPCVPCI